MKLLIVVVLCRGVGIAQSNDCDTLDNCLAALQSNPRSSLIHFRIAEFYFQRGSYMISSNKFRESLDGDLQPRWTEVWSHINLGKIYDATGQRVRALNEYRVALRTNDNTRGALDEAKKYTETPYRPN